MSEFDCLYKQESEEVRSELSVTMRFSDDVLQRELIEIHLPVISAACSNLLTAGVWLEVVCGGLVLVSDHRNLNP